MTRIHSRNIKSSAGTQRKKSANVYNQKGGMKSQRSLQNEKGFKSSMGVFTSNANTVDSLSQQKREQIEEQNNIATIADEPDEAAIIMNQEI
jgi:hypothetical protein